MFKTAPDTLVGSFVAVAAGDYADNDVISNDADAGEGDPISFAGRRAGTIFKGTLKCSEDGVVASSRLHLFKSAPLAAEVEMDDNAAFAILTAAGVAKYLGYIDFPALADFGVGSFSQTADGLRFGFDLSEATVLYGVLQLLDAETNETAGMTITIELQVW